MNGNKENSTKTLGRFLDRHFNPSSEQVESAGERVLQRLQEERSTASERLEQQATPIGPKRKNWKVSIAVAAAAMMLVVALSATLVRYNNDANAIAKTPDGRTYSAGETAHSDSATGTVLALSDGSHVEMRSGAEASVERASDGLRINLKNGSIIVRAAKQAPGRHLYVKTKDVTVSVVGTVFLVRADDNGSRVAVLEGEVRVQQNGTEKSLHPGEQTSSNEKLQALALQAEIGWSREASAYLGMLHQLLAQSVASRQGAPRGTVVPRKPQFEVASVRPCEEDFKVAEGMRGGGSNSIRMAPGRLDALCVTAATLIRIAYRELDNNYAGAPVPGDPLLVDRTYGMGVEDGTRVRGPDWTRSERYTITAVAQGPVDAQTLAGPMLLDLLERRFQLKLHVDSEEVPVWGLGIARGGLKLKPTSPGSCVTRPAIGPLDEDGWRKFLASLTKPLCGNQGQINGDPRSVKMVAAGVSMPELAQTLSLQAWKDGDFFWPLSATLGNLRVIDKTGIPKTTRFDYTLEYGSDREHFAFFSLQPITDPQPTIFDALEKLGLILERTKSSREFIVIDRIERPAPN